MKEVNTQSHEADAVVVEVAKVKTSLKRRAEDTMGPPSVVINECIANISQSIQATMPRASSMTRSIR